MISSNNIGFVFDFFACALNYYSKNIILNFLMGLSEMLIPSLIDLRYASIIIIAAIYMLFDVFNKRNVPSIFVYATLGYGVLLTLLYLDLQLIFYSGLLATAILGFGYFIYRIGQIGAADIVEFAAISLILPITPLPLLVHVQQLSIPFILAMLVNTGMAVFVFVPIYYIPRAFYKFKRKLYGMIRKEDVFRAAMLAVLYVAFMSLLIFTFWLKALGFLIVLIMALGSVLITLFVTPITKSMIRYITYRGLEPGDAIALNLIPKGLHSDLNKRVVGFGGLVTSQLIDGLRRKAPKAKLPVYRNAVPFALPIFVGALTTLIFGNMILLVFV